MNHQNPQSDANAPQPRYGPPFGHMRNGPFYPDPFPCEPPTDEEADALKLTPAQRIALEQILLGSQLAVAAKASST